MQRYGGWLKREARKGRFHFFPLGELLRRLGEAGFGPVEHRRSDAGQAYFTSGLEGGVPRDQITPEVRLIHKPDGCGSFRLSRLPPFQ